MRQPPTGTVTFLFTDIEGSTHLWDSNPAAMRPALARHDALLRQAITQHGGYVFKTVGDAFCAAFPTATESLAAALAAQLALAAEQWELPTPLRVRMALHTGSAEQRDGDYFGPPLNRVARLLAVGHGGQTLLSLAAQELTRDALPPAASLLDLGAHRLKDLGRPETVFQLLHPSLPAKFPPLRSLDSPDLPNNLPQQATSFVGREKELVEVKALLGRTRLLTLTGAGGTGKTRLSLQAAADLLDQYDGGVWLVELASLSDPALIPQAVAQALGVKEQAGKTAQKVLVDWLRSRHALLLLDNCEHLVAACASLASDLLRNCPGVHIFATSREPLHVAGEQTYRVPSLSSPDPRKMETVETLSQYEAVTLFIERARAVQPSFSVTDANAPAVAQVCFHLDGIPLAIELAAARVRSLPVEQINTRLDQRFRLLTGGSRDTLPRQQTLRALIDWSYDLLTEQEKALLRRLSVFAGGWTLEAAERVCAGGPVEDWEVLDLLASLVDKSLVVYEEGEGGVARYRFLETIRHYGLERLQEKGEEQDTRQRHLDFFLAFAEGSTKQLLDEHQHECVRHMQMEADNLRAALAQSQGDTQVALRLAGALRLYWVATGLHAEGQAHLTAALGLPGAQKRTTARASALIGVTDMMQQLSKQRQPDWTEARHASEEALSIFRELGDGQGMALALLGLGKVVSDQGHYELGQAHLEEGLALSLTLGDWNGVLWTLNFLGNSAQRHGHTAAARQHWERAVALAREKHLDTQSVYPLLSLAILTRDEGQQDMALAIAEEGLRLARLGWVKGNLTWAAEVLAELYENKGEVEEALRLLTEAEAICKSVDWNPSVLLLILMTRAYLVLGDYASAQAYLTRSLGMTVSEEEKHLVGWLPQYQGDLALIGENKDKARLFYRESLSDFWEQQEMTGVFLALSGLSATEEAERAAHLHGATQTLIQTDRRVRSILKSHARQRQMYANAVAVSRAAQGEQAFIAAWNAGRAMALDEAVAYALGER